jgi:hypothetical protein
MGVVKTGVVVQAACVLLDYSIDVADVPADVLHIYLAEEYLEGNPFNII